MRVVWTKPAQGQLKEILDYLQQKNLAAAVRVAAETDARMKQLAEFPNLGRPGRVVGTRELVLGGLPYLIAYRVSDRIEILAMMHGAQEWPDKF